MRVRFITGNHDASFTKTAGVDVGQSLALARPDWEFIGPGIGTIELTNRAGNKLRVTLMHPDGGAAYALSYKPQKIIEQIPGGSKPDLIAIGHFHKAEMMPSYRNVAGFQSGCFQYQTPFMSTKGLAAHVGGWIIRVIPSARGEYNMRILSEFIPFF